MRIITTEDTIRYGTLDRANGVIRLDVAVLIDEDGSVRIHPCELEEGDSLLSFVEDLQADPALEIQEAPVEG